jgi:hypothetical protein
MGLNRSMLAAQRLYDERTGKKADGGGKKRTNGSLDRWAKNYNWEARALAWDNEKAALIQSALLKADQQGYIQRIEDSRDQLERTATMGMQSAEAALTIVVAQLHALEKEAGEGILPKESLDRLLTLTRIAKEAIDSLGSGKTELYDALGLVQIIEQFAQPKR